MKIKKTLPLTILLINLFLLSGCHHTPEPDSGFLEHPETLKEDDTEPFDAVWFKENEDYRKYKKIFIAPVDTAHLLKMSWWDNISLSETITNTTPEMEAKILADYFKEKITEAFKDEKDPVYQVVDTPDKETLIIELAIVKVVPTKVWLNSISYIIAGALDTGATAIEGRFRDGATNEAIFRFKDERSGPYSIVNVGDFTWYSHSKDTLELWSTILVNVCKKAPNETVSSPIPFTLLPW